ncbi:MAG: DUF3592 domain-containing protein [Candidatus Electrothrix sp. ATG2]|nr:DUF3592 domain-containing protein [Candidatus Electrothrix sp. ATG2]
MQNIPLHRYASLMSKHQRPISDIIVGLFIFFSAIALSLSTIQQSIRDHSDPLEALPTFGFCAILFLLSFAKITGRRTFLQIVWLIIGLGLSGLGAMVSFTWSIPGVLAVWETENWQETPCTILTSEVSTEKKDDGMIRHPTIRYTYSIDGHRYESSVVDVFWTPINGGLNAQNIVNNFPREKETVCWVNPKNLHDSSLQRGWQPMHYVAFLPLTLIIPGLAMMIAAFWKQAPSPRAKT